MRVKKILTIKLAVTLLTFYCRFDTGSKVGACLVIAKAGRQGSFVHNNCGEVRLHDHNLHHTSDSNTTDLEARECWLNRHNDLDT